MGKTIISSIAALGLFFSPLAFSQPQSSARVIVETDIRDDDSSRLALDFGVSSLDELSDLPEKLRAHQNILPANDANIRIHVFVPSRLDEATRQQFLAEVKAGLTAHNPGATVTLVPLDIDLEQARRNKQASNEQIQYVQNSLNSPQTAELSRDLQQENDEILADLEKWEKDMRGYSKRRDKRIGRVIGFIRGGASAIVWWASNGMTHPTLMQIAGSAFLDWIYSEHGDDINNFKNSHRLPYARLPERLQNVVKFYNSRPLLKSWIFDNLVGFWASSYFRFWSHIRDPQRTSAPWSPDALSTFLGAFTIGNIAAAVGSQGPRLLRKKGYIGSRLEHYLAITYGVIFQVGGFFYGLGWNKAVIVHSILQGSLEVSVYAIGRALPLKDPRTLVIHPDFTKEELEELLYRIGLRTEELAKVSDAELPERIENLKYWQSLSWKEKMTVRYQKFRATCAEILNGKKEDLQPQLQEATAPNPQNRYKSPNSP